MDKEKQQFKNDVIWDVIHARHNFHYLNEEDEKLFNEKFRHLFKKEEMFWLHLGIYTLRNWDAIPEEDREDCSMAVEFAELMYKFPKQLREKDDLFYYIVSKNVSYLYDHGMKIPHFVPDLTKALLIHDDLAQTLEPYYESMWAYVPFFDYQIPDAVVGVLYSENPTEKFTLVRDALIKELEIAMEYQQKALSERQAAMEALHSR